jgi:hypothetical protein
MKRKLRKTSVRLAIAVAVGLVATGGALAHYSSVGSGSGNASVASPDPLTIAARTPAAGLLYPGGSGELDAHISNPNPFKVRVNSLVLGSGGIQADGGHSGCDTSVLHYTTQNNGGSGWDVPAKVGAVDGTLDLALTGALAMDSTAADACQGATFTVSLVTGP